MFSSWDLFCDEFRKYIKEFKGIQSMGILLDEDENPFFVLNIFEKHFSKNKKEIPNSYKGIRIKIEKINNDSFL